MAFSGLTGTQAGVKLSEAHQIVAENWGRNPESNSTKNKITRCYNRALRRINLMVPMLEEFYVVNATATLQSGITEYDVRRDTDDGGFGWTDCVQIQNLAFEEIDNRPLERLTLEQYRDRALLLEQNGTPESWVLVDRVRILVYPTPDRTYTGIGDYWRQLPSITDKNGKIDGWPQVWDEVVLAGTEYYYALARTRDAPGAASRYKSEFIELLSELDTWAKTLAIRPFQVRNTRYMRSRRYIPHDNSTDVGFYRR